MKFFNENSKMVQSAILLLTNGTYKSIEQIPNLFNLREEVQKIMDAMK